MEIFSEFKETENPPQHQGHLKILSVTCVTSWRCGNMLGSYTEVDVRVR